MLVSTRLCITRDTNTAVTSTERNTLAESRKIDVLACRDRRIRFAAGTSVDVALVHYPLPRPIADAIASTVMPRGCVDLQ